MKEFKVIQIKTSEFDGRMYYDLYEYVSKIITDSHGYIKITTCGDVLDAMRFIIEDNNIIEYKFQENMLNFVKSYFPKKDYEITYHTVEIVY